LGCGGGFATAALAEPIIDERVGNDRFAEPS